MKNLMILASGLLFLLLSLTFAEDRPAAPPHDSTGATEADSNDSHESDRIVVYYLHMNRRCMTCEKLEAYSQEAISTGFAEQLKDSIIIWRIENFEQEGNEHFVEDYQLYSQSLILSRQHDGREVQWKNLDKIWKLVGNKEQFITYVQSEVTKFINPTEEE